MLSQFLHILLKPSIALFRGFESVLKTAQRMQVTFSREKQA
jgi:hypothetical protein